MYLLYICYLEKNKLAIPPVFEMLSSISGLTFHIGILPIFVGDLPSLINNDLNKGRYDV